MKMEISDIIGLVASVATILLILFKIKKPTYISLQVFLCLLIIVCVVIFALIYITDGKDGGSDTLWKHVL